LSVTSLDQESLLERRHRIHAIVEGALLGDIAIVFLLMRVYLPLPPVRALISTIAAISIVMLTQRRGIRTAVLATVSSYILFSALVGPILALAAIDVGVSGVLAGIGRKLGLGPAINTLWTGPVYALLDLVIPTIASLLIFRYPVKDLIKSARNFVKLVFNFVQWVSHRFQASASTIHQIKGWEQWAVDHWIFSWIGVMVLYGLLKMYLVVIVSEMVLNQVPEHILARQRAGS
jgi:hypothetical protein